MLFNRTGLKFIRNEAQIANLTAFHCVYPNEGNLLSQVGVDILFAYFLCDIAKEIFSDNRREYGNGLQKFEPNDLNKAMMLDLTRLRAETISEIRLCYLLQELERIFTAELIMA
jgi:adenine-specific DNA-methyltransferase